LQNAKPPGSATQLSAAQMKNASSATAAHGPPSIPIRQQLNTLEVEKNAQQWRAELKYQQASALTHI